MPALDDETVSLVQNLRGRGVLCATVFEQALQKRKLSPLHISSIEYTPFIKREKEVDQAEEPNRAAVLQLYDSLRGTKSLAGQSWDREGFRILIKPIEADGSEPKNAILTIDDEDSARSSHEVRSGGSYLS